MVVAQTLASYDQYSNMILQDASERHIVFAENGITYYCDVPLGMYIVRGDSMVLTGLLNEMLQDNVMTKVSKDELDELKGKTPLNWDVDQDLIA